MVSFVQKSAFPFPIVALCIIFGLSVLAGCTGSGQDSSKEVDANPDEISKPLSMAEIRSLIKSSYRHRQNDGLIEAVKHLKYRIIEYPNDPENYIALGWIYNGIEEFNYQEKIFPFRPDPARKMFEKAISLDPENGEAYAGLVYSLSLNPEKYEREIIRKNAGKALNSNLDDPKLLFHLGNNCILFKLDDLAVQSFEKVIQAGKQIEAKSYVLEAKESLGRIYTRQKDYERAEQVLLDARKDLHNNDWACAYQALGELYFKTGNVEKMAKSYLKAAEADGGGDNAYFRGAIRAFELGNFGVANTLVKKIENVEGDEKFLVLAGFINLVNKKYEEAKRVFDSLPDTETGKIAGDTGHGHLKIAQQKYEEAEKLLLPAIKYSKGELLYKDQPTNAIVYRMAHLGLGWINANKNDHAKAMEYFHTALRYGQKDVLTLLGAGNSLIGLGRLDEAEIKLNEVLEIDPKNPYALAELGIIKLKRGNLSKAEENFLAALDQDNTNYTCPYEGLGLLYMKQGKIVQAKKNLKLAIEINPDIEFKKYNALAKIYIKEGKIEKARALLRKSSENFPYDNEAANLLKSLKENGN